MIDLHCHMLPGIDDGAKDLDTALEMARIAVGDGIVMTACTPHIYPGLFENNADQIKRQVQDLRAAIKEVGIALEITFGADVHMVPEMLQGLRTGHMPTLHDTRYFLFEPPHHTIASGFSRILFDLLAAGYVPVITHPERLTWLDHEHYEWFVDAAHRGAWIQLTAGAVTGRFGRRPKYWSERFLDDGLVHVLATDGHDPRRRPPLLEEGRLAAERYVGAQEADLLVTGRTRAVIENRKPADVPPPPALGENPRHQGTNQSRMGWLSRLFGRA